MIWPPPCARWLPRLDTIQVHKNYARPAVDKVYNARFKTQGYGVTYMGRVDRSFLLYIEHPHPLPQDHKQLSAQDVLMSDLMETKPHPQRQTSYPRVAFIVRTFIRYRAYQPEGPYERVRILLADVRFPEEVNLTFPGYP